MVDALHEILKFLRIAMLPTLIGSRMAPALLGADLLRDIDVFENLFARVEGLERVDELRLQRVR